MKEPKLTRDEKATRRALEKQFLLGLKQNAKAADWSYLKPTVFKRVGEWFIYVNPIIYTERYRTELQATVKPFAIDDLMSRVCGFDGLDGTPLSLRARGPHCLVLPMWTIDIESGGDVAAMLEGSATFLRDLVDKVEALRLDDFVAFTGTGSVADRVSHNHVAALLLAQRNDEAVVLCERAIETKQWGGPARVTEDGRMVGFFELAVGWLQHNRQIGP